MAYESSTAPKERVNIVYRPATGDSREEVELPLKLLVVGDFTLRGEATSIEDMKSINVDKDNFNEVLKGQKLALALVVSNHLEANPGSDAQLTVNLEFESIHDFSPDAVVQKVPEVCQMIALRDALKALKGPLGNNPHFRKRVQALIVDDTGIELTAEASAGQDKSRIDIQPPMVNVEAASAFTMRVTPHLMSARLPQARAWLTQGRSERMRQASH